MNSLEASSGSREEAQRERNLLPRTKSAPVLGEKGGLEGHLLFNKGKNGVNQPATSDSNCSSIRASNLTPRLIYMTTDLTACTCPQNIPSLAEDSSKDGVTELMTVSGEYTHVPQDLKTVLSCVLPTLTWDVTQE